MNEIRAPGNPDEILQTSSQCPLRLNDHIVFPPDLLECQSSPLNPRLQTETQTKKQDPLLLRGRECEDGGVGGGRALPRLFFGGGHRHVESSGYCLISAAKQEVSGGMRCPSPFSGSSSEALL